MEKEIEIVSTPADYQGVKGISVIDNRIRCELALPMEYYAILDAIFAASKNGVLKTSYSELQDIIWKKCGLRSLAFRPAMINLIEMGFLKFEKESFKYTVSERFTKYFNHDTDFEELWIAYERIGNKAEAKACYTHCRKIATKEDIYKGCMAYLKYKKKLGTARQYIFNLQTLLNPNKRKWEDKYENEEATKQSTQYKFKKQ